MIENPKSVYIETYGCSNNQAESQMMAALLRESGFTLVNDERSADIVVINTCGVKNTTENKIMHRISALNGKKLIVAGCLPEANRERIRAAAQNASLVSTNHLQRIAVAADFLLDGHAVEFLGSAKEEKIKLPKVRENHVIDIVTIASGCSTFCAFCSTKLAKGELFSYGEEDIINEMRAAKIGGGAREFWLTAQDCGCYGFDADTNIARLIKNITSSVPGEYFVRMGMANPQHLKRVAQELIDAFRDQHVFKFLHVPVQSGSDSVLVRMRRGHTTEDFSLVVEEFRKAFPDVTIWTDMIVGFPNESDDDFKKSIELLRTVRPDVVNISSFSRRPGTRAAKMKQVPSEIRKERTRMMSELAREIALERNRAWIGWGGPALVDEYKAERKNFIARNYAYKPIALHGEHELGQIVDVRITGALPTCLLGEAS